MEGVLSFVQAHKPHFDVAQALSSVVNLVAWLLALLLLIIALRKNRIESLSVGPFSFRMTKEEAIVATATASRAWQSASGEKVDVPRFRATVDRVFTPKSLDNLTGKAILWVDDNPANNELAVRALKKFGLDIERATSTEAAMVCAPVMVYSSCCATVVAGPRSLSSRDQTRRSSGARPPNVVLNYRPTTCSNWSTTL
jgi:hypothetical protein